MARLIHYIVKKPQTHPEPPMEEHFNHKVGGGGDLSDYQVDLVKRRLAKKHHLVDPGRIILCNVIQMGKDNSA